MRKWPALRTAICSVAASLWVAWAIVTAGDFITIGPPTHWNYIPNALFNLFTPILYANWGLITMLVLIAGLWAGDELGKRIKITVLRIGYNFLVLFLLTVATDMITWGHPYSLERIQ
jgi:hypothetical protein